MVPTRRRKVTSAFYRAPAGLTLDPALRSVLYSPGSRAWVVSAWPLTPRPPVFPHPCMIMAGRHTLAN